MKRGLRVVIGALVVLAGPAAGRAQVVQEQVDLDVVNRIREEGLEHSQLPELIRYITEVIGPRVTGSPQMKQANDWTADKLRSMGFTNVVVEPWGDFGKGWEEVSYSGRVVTPYAQPLDARPVAWTGSTKGTIRGPAVILQADSVEDLAKYKGKLKGAIVLNRAPPDVEPEWDPAPRRLSLDYLLGPPDTAAMAARARMAQERQQRMTEMRARFQRMREMRDQLSQMLKDEGVAVILTPSARNFSVVAGGGNNAGREAGSAEPIPELVVTREQYNQIYRNVDAGVPVTLEVNIQNKFYDQDLKAYNTLGDMPGTDKADEFIMIGGHLDSWHYGTGAADNAAGVAVMMEAMRILKALDLQPRRTIRIGLWSGEEQGLLGSRGWVQNHPEMYPKISAYLNYDNGTGRIRGIWDQMNEQAIPIFEQILWPFQDLGVVAVKHGNTGGTDHLSFDAVGVPGFNFIQDPIEYGIRIHHTDVDTYDNLVLDDLKQSAVVAAFTIWELANREEMMPRKPAAPSTN
jgi:hypothetical protein